MSDRIIRLPEVITLTGLSRSTIYLRMSNGHFPKPISLGGRAVGFIEKEIQDWICNQIRITRGE
jgi:prophage regulatory protein